MSSIRPGTLSTSRPAPVSMAPAAIRRFVAAHGRDELLEGDVVGLERGGVDQHLQQVLAVAPPMSTSSTPGTASMASLASFASSIESALGQRARHDGGENRKEGRVDLGHDRDRWRRRAARTVALVHRLAHVIERGVGVEARLELELQGGVALGGVRADLLEALQRLELASPAARPAGAPRRPARCPPAPSRRRRWGWGCRARPPWGS